MCLLVSAYVNNDFVKYKILNTRIIANIELGLMHIAAYVCSYKWPLRLRAKSLSIAINAVC